MDENSPAPREATTSDEPTISHVAREAGVSVGTVSNVLNHPDKVSAATLAKVRDAIERTGFIRNGNARSLASRATDTVALIVPSMSNTFFVDMSTGARAAARELGMSLLIASADDDFNQQDRYLDLFAEARSTGILLAPMHDSVAGIKRMRDHGRTIVVVNYDEAQLDCCTVLMDNAGVGSLAVEHLVGLGVGRIVLVATDDFVQPVRERRVGIRAAVRDSGSGVALDEVEVVNFDPSEGRRVGEAIARAWNPGDAAIGLIAITDSIALGLIEGVRSRPQIRIPEDIAVMGLDGNREYWDAPIGISTFELPGYTMGMEAMRLLIDENRSGDHVHRHIVLPATLNARESTLGR
jgi:LacI family transcriptional regulator